MAESELTIHSLSIDQAFANRSRRVLALSGLIPWLQESSGVTLIDGGIYSWASVDRVRRQIDEFRRVLQYFGYSSLGLMQHVGGLHVSTAAVVAKWQPNLTMRVIPTAASPVELRLLNFGVDGFRGYCVPPLPNGVSKAVAERVIYADASSSLYERRESFRFIPEQNYVPSARAGIFHALGQTAAREITPPARYDGVRPEANELYRLAGFHAVRASQRLGAEPSIYLSNAVPEAHVDTRLTELDIDHQLRVPVVSVTLPPALHSETVAQPPLRVPVLAR